MSKDTEVIFIQNSYSSNGFTLYYAEELSLSVSNICLYTMSNVQCLGLLISIWLLWVQEFWFVFLFICFVLFLP